jgi:hypothetical protein
MNNERISRRAALAAGLAGFAGAATLAAPAMAADPSKQRPNVLRVEWYDLPSTETDRFVHWLHGDYLPRLTTQAGVIWVGHYKIRDNTGAASATAGMDRSHTRDASVPKGSQYLLITAGASPETFVAWESPVATLEKQEARKLAVRREYREAVFIEQLRFDGPEAKGDWTASPPPALQMGNFNVRAPGDEVELAHYYRLVRFPELAVTPGCIGARKFVSIQGWPKHGILYAFSAMNPGEQLFEVRMAANRKPPPIKLRPVLEYVVHAPKAPHAGTRIWP